jgi:GTP-binding protein
MEDTIPKVVIVGRTNVGKSSLFNRLVAEQKSLVSEVPGTTRDRYEADCIWRGEVIRVVDTGGLDVDYRDEIEKSIADQARLAMKQADLILFVTDAQSGIQPEDRELAKELLDSKVPVITVANKADNVEMQNEVSGHEWENWPLGKPQPISAFKSLGVGDMLDEVYKMLREESRPPVEVREITSLRVAVIGRPNVGKSSLLNALLGEHRFIEANIEHTTREPNDTMITVNGQKYTLVDTAGIRKMARINAGKSKLEQSGVSRTIRAMKRADVVLFVVDVTQPIRVQDKHLAGKLAESKTSVIIVPNKWDLVPGKETNTINEYERYFRAHLPMLDYAPLVFTSAKTGKRVQVLFEVIDEVYQSRFTELTKDETRQFISRAIVKHKPSRGKGVQHPEIRYFEQIGINPPLFHLGIRQTRKDALHDSYRRFLENELREHYNFVGCPIRIAVKERKKKHTTI